MKSYHYADGVENILLAEGMVRLDLFHYGERQGQQCAHDVTEQLVMPLPAFLRAYESARKMMEQLEQQGLITKAPAPAEGPSDSPTSPNFS